MDRRPDAEYVSLASRATCAKALLLLACAVDAAGALTSFSLARLVDEAHQTGAMMVLDAETAESRHALVRTLQLGVHVVGGLAFLLWFHRAYANLAAVSAEGTRHHPGWAIGAWFVPVLSFVWPKRIANEIWRGSNPETDPRGSKTPPLYDAWWRTFVVAGLFVAAGSALWSNGGTMQDLEIGALLQLVGNLLGLASALLAFVVVHRTSRRQAARAAKLEEWRGLHPHGVIAGVDVERRPGHVPRIVG